MWMIFFLSFECVIFVKNLEADGCDFPVLNISIVMSIDESYVRYSIVAMTSLLENGNRNTFYEVNVLIPGSFKQESKIMIGSLKEKYKNCEFTYANMSNKYEGVLTKRGVLPPPIYYRLQIASMLPRIKKCIFLDSDIIVRHDLSEMYNIDIDDYYIGGVWSGWVGLPKNYLEVLRIPDVNQYVCAGVLIMSLENIRKDKLEEKFSELLKIKSNHIIYADQDIINIACYGRILCLPLKFGLLINSITRENSLSTEWKNRDPVIVHFAGHSKPWKDSSKTFFHEEFWKYAKITGFYDEEIKKINEKKCYLMSPKMKSFTTNNYKLRKKLGKRKSKLTHSPKQGTSRTV